MLWRRAWPCCLPTARAPARPARPRGHAKAPQERAEHRGGSPAEPDDGLLDGDPGLPLVLASMEPEPPAINLHANLDHMQDKIRIELHLMEDEDEQDHLHEAGGPAPDVLVNRQPDAQRAERGGRDFGGEKHRRVTHNQGRGAIGQGAGESGPVGCALTILDTGMSRIVTTRPAWGRAAGVIPPR